MQVLDQRWSVRELTNLRGFSIEWAEPDRILVSRRNHLFRLTGLTGRPEPVATFPDALWKRLVSQSRLGQRLLRFMFYNVMPMNEDRVFVTFAKGVGLFVDGEFVRLKGLERPTRVLRGACAAGEDGSLFFGEYLGNVERQAIRIYRLRVGTPDLEIAHTFPAGEVRHVHGIYSDPYSRYLWCLTGDNRNECRIMRTDDGFRTIELVGGGDETWRAVSLLFGRDSVFYGSDAEFEQNYVYRWYRDTRRRERLSALEGPVYYSYANGSDRFLAVTAEGCPSQSENVASIWHVPDDEEPTRVFRVPKDGLPNHFMPGTLHFPNGPGIPSTVLFHTVAVKGDNRCFCLVRR